MSPTTSPAPNAKTLLQPSAIDVSRLPDPHVLEALNYEQLQQAYINRFLIEWNAVKASVDTSTVEMPDYDVELLQTDPVTIASQAFSFVRLTDRARVNDAAKALLAAHSKGTDLDAIAARQNLTRLAGENDVKLLRRYLLSFERAAAGSRAAFLFRAFTAVPGLHDCEVNGQAVHGRLGDVEIVVATNADGSIDQAAYDLVSAAVTNEEAVPETTGVTVMAASPLPYSVHTTVRIPRGPDPTIVKQEVEARLIAATSARAFIGASVPADYVTGAAYGDNIIDVTREPTAQDVVATRYQIPVLSTATAAVQVA